MSSLGCTPGGGAETLADDELPEHIVLVVRAEPLVMLHGLKALRSGERGGRFAAQMALESPNQHQQSSL